MKSLKLILPIFILLFNVTTIRSQTLPFPIDSLVRNPLVQMSASRVNSGILEDLGANSVYFRDYNGQSLADSNYVNNFVLSTILQSLRNSSFSQNSFPSSHVYRDSLSKIYGRGNNPVSILFYKYHYLKSNALTDSLVVQKSDLHIEDRFNEYGAWVNPYDSSFVFCFAPYISYSKDEVVFYFRNDLVMSNHPITSILFDPGDGGGYRSIALQGVTKISVDYNATGIESKELKMKLVLTDNTELLAHSPFVAFEEIGTGNTHYHPKTYNNIVTPDDSLTITASQSYMGYQPSAKAYVFYANGRNSIHNPFIYVEGFDPLPKLEDLMSNSGVFGQGNMTYNDLYLDLPDSIKNKYDIVYIDWQMSTAPIEANSDIVKQVIQWVNCNKVTTERNVLMGYSMGGIIARYTLCSMEANHLPHDVKTYISHDAPHYGANIPTGLLYAAQYLFRIIDELDSVNLLDFLGSLLISQGAFSRSEEEMQLILQSYLPYLMALRNAPSVRQMLWNYVNCDLTPDNTLYNQTQSQLLSMGMPSGDEGASILNLCISNGGINTFITPNTPRELFSISIKEDWTVLARILIGDLLALLVSNEPTPLILLTSKSQTNTELGIFADRSIGNIVFEASVKRRVITIFGDYTQTLWQKIHNSSNLSYGIDDAYGSYYSPHGIIIPNVSAPLPSTVLTEGGALLINSQLSRFMFVPTVSSLAYKLNRSLLTPSDYHTDFRTTGVDYDYLPFNGYHLPDSSLHHVQNPSEDAYLWADRMQDLSFENPSSSPETGYIFRIHDSHPEKGTNYNVVWSTSDSSKATVSSTGILHVESGGSVTIYADIQYLGGHMIVSKSVYLPLSSFPGFPSYSLSVDDGIPNLNGVVENYIVTATALSSLPDSITRKMTYWWGIKRNTTDQITWISQNGIFGPNPSKTFFIPESANCRMVFFYVTYGPHISTTYSVCCWLSEFILLMNPDGYLFVPGNNNPVVQVKSNIDNEVTTIVYEQDHFVFQHFPSASEICLELMKNESFIELLKTLKPWGSQEMLLIPYWICLEKEDPKKEYICIIYKEFDPNYE